MMVERRTRGGRVALMPNLQAPKGTVGRARSGETGQEAGTGRPQTGGADLHKRDCAGRLKNRIGSEMRFHG